MAKLHILITKFFQNWGEAYLLEQLERKPCISQNHDHPQNKTKLTDQPQARKCLCDKCLFVKFTTAEDLHGNWLNKKN